MSTSESMLSQLLCASFQSCITWNFNGHPNFLVTTLTSWISFEQAYHFRLLLVSCLLFYNSYIWKWRRELVTNTFVSCIIRRSMRTMKTQKRISRWKAFKLRVAMVRYGKCILLLSLFWTLQRGIEVEGEGLFGDARIPFSTPKKTSFF